jgi:hypothetical protein
VLFARRFEIVMRRETTRPAPKTQKSESYSIFVSLYYLLVIIFSMVSVELLAQGNSDGFTCAILTTILGFSTIGLMLKEMAITLDDLKAFLMKFTSLVNDN